MRLHAAALTIQFNLICNILCSEKLNFDLLIPTFTVGRGGGGGGLRLKHLRPCRCISDSIKNYMQHDHVLQRLNFDLLTPTFTVARGVCG